MQLADIVTTLRGKADLYDDRELAFAAQELELHAQLDDLPPPAAYASNALFNVISAARYLSLSTDYVFKLIYSGELPSLKIGKRRLVRRTDLDAFIKRKVNTGARRLTEE